MLVGRFLRKKKLNGERGQSLAEFALIVPIFLILVFSIVDFGMGFHAWITVTNSAREGARLGAVGGSEAQIIERVRDTAGTLKGQLDVTVDNAQGGAGQSVAVDVRYRYDFITPLGGLMAMISGNTITDSVTLSSKAEMRLE